MNEVLTELRLEVFFVSHLSVVCFAPIATYLEYTLLLLFYCMYHTLCK